METFCRDENMFWVFIEKAKMKKNVTRYFASSEDEVLMDF